VTSRELSGALPSSLTTASADSMRLRAFDQTAD
jgi:hypothetical protein